jgi:hypothetical protein
MVARKSSSVLSAAIALAADDPDVGPIKLRKGWSGRVTPVPDRGTERELSLTSADGRTIVLRRFASARERPETYPASIVYLEGHTAWAGASELGSAAVWIQPPDPAAVAATAVSDSVQDGWNLDSSVNSAGIFGYAALKSVVLTRRGARRGIAIVSGHVTLLELPIEPAGLADDPSVSGGT